LKFIDINCMVGEWGYKKLNITTPDDLVKEMKRLNIYKALVFDSRSWMHLPSLGNDIITKEVMNYKNLLPVMALTPLIEQEFGGYEQILTYIKRNKITAIRLFPTDHGYAISKLTMGDLFAFLEKIKIPVFVQCVGRMRGGSPANLENYYEQICELAYIYNELPIVLLTTHYSKTRMIYKLLSKCPNISVDTSGISYFNGIEDMVKYFGSERIFFGSRMPFNDGGVAVGRIIYSSLDYKDKENIAYKNAIRLLSKNEFLCDVMEGVTNG